MSGIGGYVRRGDRRHVPPVPDDGIPRCGHCKARLDIVTPWNQPHICKEVTFGTPVTPYRSEIYPDTGNTGVAQVSRPSWVQPACGYGP